MTNEKIVGKKKMARINGRKRAIYHLLFSKSVNGNICILCHEFWTNWYLLRPTQLAPQNDSLTLNFVKDENIVGKKMTRNSRKTAISTGRLGWLHITRWRSSRLLYCSLFDGNSMKKGQVSRRLQVGICQKKTISLGAELFNRIEWISYFLK